MARSTRKQNTTYSRRRTGGYRATVVTSDHHAARQVFQNVSEPSAEYLLASGCANFSVARMQIIRLCLRCR